jgi:hypothetical protein
LAISKISSATAVASARSGQWESMAAPGYGASAQAHAAPSITWMI